MGRLTNHAYNRLRQMIAIVMGGLFVLTGCAILFADPDNEKAGVLYNAPFYELVRAITDLLGKTGGGLFFIGVGLGLGGLLFRAASR